MHDDVETYRRRVMMTSSQVPAEVGTISTLRALFLDFNRIKSVATEIYQLER
jgi:hypothetical protein